MSGVPEGPPAREEGADSTKGAGEGVGAENGALGASGHEALGASGHEALGASGHGPAKPAAGRRAIELEDMPKRRRGCTCIAVTLVVGFALLALLAGAGFFAISAVGGNRPGEGEVPVRVEEGQNVGQVAQTLQEKGVIRSASAFRWYLKFKGIDLVIQAGDYEFKRDMGADAVVAVLKAGPLERFRTLTLAPGLTVKEQGVKVEEQLEGMTADGFTEALANGLDGHTFPQAPNAEGLCFPETYRIDEKMDEAGVAETCLTQFDQVFAGLDKSRLADLNVTPYEAVIIASLIEEETKVPEERPVVASVIYNRLKKGMLLQIDATVLYALGEHKTQVLYKDLEVDSPYNTYKVKGLPPTPIAAPGKSSLEAALNPAKTDYLYYVLTDESGKHAFTADSREFERLKADAQRRGVY